MIAWTEIRGLDQTGWNAPLAVHLTFADKSQLLVVYPGDFDACASLLRHLRRYSRLALLDGVPYREFWGEPLESKSNRRLLTIPCFGRRMSKKWSECFNA